MGRLCAVLRIVGPGRLLLVLFAAGLLLAVTAPARANKPHAEPTNAQGQAEQGPEAEEGPGALEHVSDDPHGKWELFIAFGEELKHFHLPKIFGFQITKFMVLEVIAALLIVWIYVPLARRLRTGDPQPAGWRGIFEVLLTFVRDQIAKPGIGEHDADRYTPFLWTMFLFILFNNLLGMLPLGASATGSIYVTGALALIVFFAIHGSAAAKMGFGRYLATLWPHIDVPFPLGYIIKPVVFVIELISVLVRNMVLAVRLFANMFAGHMVLATILIFIYAAAHTAPALWATVTISSVFGMVALSLLELFVAFLQAYIFTFLTSLFMGMALHPAH